MYGVYHRLGGHIIVAGIRDHGNGVDPWSKHERFREHPLTGFRGYGGHRVYTPFPPRFSTERPTPVSAVTDASLCVQSTFPTPPP